MAIYESTQYNQRLAHCFPQIQTRKPFCCPVVYKESKMNQTVRTILIRIIIRLSEVFEC